MSIQETRPRSAPASTPLTRPATAVIVAAGIGGRLREGQTAPKPLVPVLGVPLIARVMAAAARAGVTRFVVVLGHRADEIRAALDELVPPGTALDVVVNERYEEPNGVSLLAAARRLDEPFCLLMSDHVFSPERLTRALEHFQREGRSLLVVEPREHFSGDLSDATRVRIRDGRVAAIGKGLEEYDAIDTGMFVLDPTQVVNALESAGPSPSISDGMRVLGASGLLDACPLTEGYWQDVDTPADVLAAQERLFASLRKPTDGFMARHVHRPISLWLTRRLWRLGVTPNMVTGGTLALGLASGAAFAHSADARWGLLGATLFQLQSIVDGVDGELARLLHKESRFGFWFDVTADNVTHAAVFFGIALGQRASGHPGPWIPLGLAAVLGVAACYLLMAPLLAPGRPGPSLRGPLRSLVEGLSRRGFTWLLFPLAALGWLGAFVWAAALGTWVYAALVVLLRRASRAS